MGENDTSGAQSNWNVSSVHNITNKKLKKSMDIVNSAMQLQSHLFDLNQLHNRFFRVQLLCLMTLSLVVMIGVGFDFLSFFFSYTQGKN
jgi:predicted membrane protein